MVAQQVLVLFVLVRIQVGLLLLAVSLLSCGGSKGPYPGSVACKPPLACGHSAQPTTVFSFSNGRNIALWQRENSDSVLPGQVAYSGFTLSECGIDSQLLTYGENTLCSVEMAPDTLIILRLSLVAMSPRLDMVYMPWLVTKIYYDKEGLNIRDSFNTAIRYNDAQIARALSRVDTARWDTYWLSKDSARSYAMMRFASQMGIASLSGSEAAAYYYRLFKERFRPGGVYALQMKEMDEMFGYKERHP